MTRAMKRAVTDAPVTCPAPGGADTDTASVRSPPKDVCVSCHARAGSDEAHSGHDFVYTQVR